MLSSPLRSGGHRGWRSGQVGRVFNSSAPLGDRSLRLSVALGQAEQRRPPQVQTCPLRHPLWDCSLAKLRIGGFGLGLLANTCIGDGISWMREG